MITVKIAKTFQTMDEQQIVENSFMTPQNEEELSNQNDKINGIQQTTKANWTYEQQLKLFKMHDQLGNKWGIIAQELTNQTDNSIKNHFYSKLRKSLRKLNKIISNNFKKELKEMKIIVLYKIIEATEQKHRDVPFCSQQLIQLSTQLKNRLLKYSYDQNQQNNYEVNPNIGNQLIFDLINFNKQYKRKTKKTIKDSEQDQDFLSPNMILNKNGKKNNSDCEQSQGSSVVPSDCSLFSSEGEAHSDEKSIKRSESIVTRKRAKSNQNIFVRKYYSHEQFKIQQDKDLENRQSQQGIQVFLKESGILQDQFLPPLPQMMKKSTSHSPMQLQNTQGSLEQKDDFHFFEQSEMQMRIIPAKPDDHFNDPFLNARNFDIFK